MRRDTAMHVSTKAVKHMLKHLRAHTHIHTHTDEPTGTSAYETYLYTYVYRTHTHTAIHPVLTWYRDFVNDLSNGICKTSILVRLSDWTVQTLRWFCFKSVL